MKVKIYKDYNRLYDIFINHYNDYNIIHKSKIDEENFFIVVEKYFFRTKNRASLSVVLTNKLSHCEATIVGSGGGQGLFFKFDWGASNSFQDSILTILDNKNIKYQIISRNK